MQSREKIVKNMLMQKYENDVMLNKTVTFGYIFVYSNNIELDQADKLSQHNLTKCTKQR